MRPPGRSASPARRSGHSRGLPGLSDPCWEMLLDLYDAALVGAEVTVTSLGAASGVPQTTALRRMETLQAHHLIVRAEDKADKRRTIIKLSDAGMQAVENFFETYLGRRT